jgi:hypothetical protein
MGGWLELFYNPDWTLDPAIFDYKMTVINPDYWKPYLATGWEFPTHPLWSSISAMMSTGRTLHQ